MSSPRRQNAIPPRNLLKNLSGVLAVEPENSYRMFSFSGQSSR